MAKFRFLNGRRNLAMFSNSEGTLANRSFAHRSVSPEQDAENETYEGATLHTTLGPDDEHLEDEKLNDLVN